MSRTGFTRRRLMMTAAGLPAGWALGTRPGRASAQAPVPPAAVTESVPRRDLTRHIGGASPFKH